MKKRRANESETDKIEHVEGNRVRNKAQRLGKSPLLKTIEDCATLSSSTTLTSS